MKFELVVVPACPGLWWNPSVLRTLEDPLEAIFEHASGGAIEFDVVIEAPHNPEEIPRMTKADLSDIVEKHLDNTPGAVSRLAMVIGSVWDYRDDVFGIMFDATLPETREVGTSLDINTNGIHREAAAVFVNALRARGFGTTKHVVRTIVHELGHVFNLSHARRPRSFMATTSHRLQPNAFVKFRYGARRFLSHCDDSEYVQPGGSAWNDRGDLGHLLL